MKHDLTKFLGCLLLTLILLPLLPAVLILLVVASLAGHPLRFGGCRNYFFRSPGMDGDAGNGYDGCFPGPGGEEAGPGRYDFEDDVIETEVISADETECSEPKNIGG